MASSALMLLFLTALTFSTAFPVDDSDNSAVVVQQPPGSTAVVFTSDDNNSTTTTFTNTTSGNTTTVITNANIVLVEPTANSNTWTTGGATATSKELNNTLTSTNSSSSACSSRPMSNLDLKKLFPTKGGVPTTATTTADVSAVPNATWSSLLPTTTAARSTWYIAAGNTDPTVIDSCTTNSFYYNPEDQTLTVNKTIKYANRTQTTESVIMTQDETTGAFRVETEQANLTYTIVATDYSNLVVVTSCAEVKNTTYPGGLAPLTGFVLSRGAAGVNAEQLSAAKAELQEAGIKWSGNTSEQDVRSWNSTVCQTDDGQTLVPISAGELPVGSTAALL